MAWATQRIQQINQRTNRETNHETSGQVGLVVLLVLVVVLALGLSLAARTTQQAEVSIQQEDTTRVFNAAEAGVEAALSNIYQFEIQGDIEGISESTTNVDIANINSDINYSVSKDNTLEIHLKQGTSTEISTLSTGTITFDWAKETLCTNTASLIVSVYADNAGTIEARHFAVGDCNGTSTRGDNFIANIAGTAPYQYGYIFSTSANDLFLRVKPVYNDTDIKITGSNSTSQFTIRSQAQSTFAGNETRTFEIKRTLSTAPALMEYTLISGSGIVKN